MYATTTFQKHAVMASCDGSSFKKILPLALILVPLGIHFVFVGCTVVANRLPLAFLFSHLVFFAVGLWTLHDQKSLLPVVVYIAVLIVTAVLDIIQLGVYFDTSSGLLQFSFGVCIINLVLKPLTGILAVFALYLRTEYGKSRLFGNSSPETPQSKPEHTAVPTYENEPTPGYGTEAGATTTVTGYAATVPGYGSEPGYVTAPGYTADHGYTTGGSHDAHSGEHPVPLTSAGGGESHTFTLH